MKKLLSFFSLVAFAGFLASPVRAADETITQDATWDATKIATHAAGDTVTIASGVTLSFDVSGDVNLSVPFTLAGAGAVKIIGTGSATAKKGTIEFTGSNTFTGGLSTESSATAANAIYVYGTQKTSFGTGTVTIKDKSHVGLKMSELENDFVIQDALGMICGAVAGCELKGNVTATTTLRLQPYMSFVISGTVTTPKTVGIRNTGDNCYGTITFRGKVTTQYLGGDHGQQYKKVDSANGYNHQRGHYTLKAIVGGHDIGYLSAAGFGKIHADGENAFPAQAIAGWGYEGAYPGTGACLNLAGYNQAIDRLQTYATDKLGYTSGAQTPNSNNADIIRSITPDTTPATATGTPVLTLRGTQNAWSMASVQDAISVDWAPTGDFTQIFSNRVSTTTGSLTVSGGTLKLGQLAQFTQVPSLTVRTGARFVVDTDKTANGQTVVALPGLTTLSVAGEGVFEYVSGGAPFTAATVAATIAAGGKIKVPSGVTLSLKSLVYDGMPVKPDTYSTASWLTGGGSVTVAQGTEIVWTKADYDAYVATHDAIVLPAGSTVVFNYADGMTSTVNQVISGAGALKFAGSGGKITVSAANTFTGGTTYAGATRIDVTTATGLGTGTVTFDSANNGKSAGLWFVGTYTLENPILVKQTSYLTFDSGAADRTMTVNSTITANPTTANVHLRGGAGTSRNVVFCGEMTGGTFYRSGNDSKGSFVFRNTANIAKFYSNSSDWGRGSVEFAGRMNASEIGTSICYFQTGAENPWSEQTLLRFYPTFDNYYQDDAQNYVINHDAVCDRIGVNGGTLYYGKTLVDGRFKKTTGEYNGTNLKSDNGSTLTMKGKGDGWTFAALKGSLNIVWDPDDESLFAFSNRLHTTTGAIEVRGGTLVAGLGCEFDHVTRIIVRSGATLRLDAQYGELYKSVFTATGLKTLELEKDAKLEVVTGMSETFGRVIYDGALVADDTYTTAKWLSGGGSVIVSSPSTVDMWKVAKSGQWGVGANWNLGTVPTSDQDVDVTVPGSSYTNTVAATPAAIKSLVIGNSKAGETATVSFQAAYAPASGGLKATVESGGVLDVSGANGSLVLAEQSKDAPIIVRRGGKITLSGSGVFRLQYSGTWGGTILSGDGALTATDDAVFSIATASAGSTAIKLGNLDMTFSGNAKFGGSGAKVSSGIYAANQSGIGQTNTWTFVDHATYGPDSPAYFHLLGSVKDCVQILRFASDATHNLAHRFCVGEGFGTGVLEIESGTVKCGPYGIYLGSEYQRQDSTCTPCGILKLTGGTIDMSSAAGGTTPNGLLVGAGWSVGYSGGVMKGGDFRGTIEMDGGTISDTGNLSHLVVGAGFATGVFNQRGGQVTKTNAAKGYPVIVGWGGGTGTWNMSGGTSDLGGYVYVGGVTTNEMGRFLKTDDNKAICVIGERTDCSAGTLDISGGTFAVGKDLVFSADGTGTLKLTGGAKLTVAGNLDARAGSKLVVDLRGYTGRSRSLATFGGTTTAFDEANVTFLKDENAPYALKITPNAIRVSRNDGFVVIIR